MEVKIPPLGFSIYRFEKSEKIPELKKIEFKNDGKQREYKEHDMKFCGSYLCHLKNKKSKIESDMKQDFFYYIPHDGNDGKQRSGVYIFRPKDNKPIRIDSDPKTVVFEGKHVFVVSITFSNYIQQNYTLIKGSNELNVDIRSGELPRNHEVTFNLSINIDNEEMYTDNNGLEMRKRKIRFDRKEKTSSNYYPLVYSSFIRDNDKQFTIISNRTVGIGYLNKGEFEIMFHRRTDYDDGRGVAEALNDYSTSNLGMKFIFDRREGK